MCMVFVVKLWTWLCECFPWFASATSALLTVVTARVSAVCRYAVCCPELELQRWLHEKKIMVRRTPLTDTTCGTEEPGFQCL